MKQALMPGNNLDETTARYLLNLRQASESGPSGSSVSDSAQSSPDSSSESDAPAVERRRYPRYKCAGSAELRKEGLTVRTWASFTDISRGGCYVEMQATFPQDTKMDLVLELNQVRVHAKAVVRVTYPFLGMGLAFTEISDEDRARLDQIIESLAGPPGSATTARPAAKTDGPGSENGLPPITDASAALDALLQYFQENAYLSREDFRDVIRESQTPPNR